MKLDDAASFSRIKTYKIHVNASITVKVLGSMSLHVMAEKGKGLKKTLAFSFFLC